MKLYQTPLSPFAARTRILIRAKGLDVELAEPPGGLGSDEYKRIAPIGKVPALEIDGEVIPESEVIDEYLEERFPEPALLPSEPSQRARARVLSRVGDLYVAAPMTGLFSQLDPATRDAASLSATLEELMTGLDRVEVYLGDGPFALGSRISTADCALAPVYFFLPRLLPMVAGPDPLEGRPKSSAWWGHVSADPHVAPILDEMAEAMKAYFG